MGNTSIQMTENINLCRNSTHSYFKSSPVFYLVYRIIRILLSFLFIWSGASKLYTLASFSVLIDAYGLVPDLLLLPVAFFISLLELIVGIGLAFDIRGCLASITLLLLLFIAVLSYGLYLGLDVDCGCFGPGDPEADAFYRLPAALVKNMFLILGVIYLYVYRFFKPLAPNTVVNIFNKIIKTRRQIQ